MKKLKREKSQWEKQRRLSEILPTKRERQEVEFLQSKLQEQLVQFKQKENRQQMTNDRLSRKIIDLEKRNREMGDEIKIFEKDRASFLELKKKYQTILDKSDTNIMKKSKSLEIKPNLNFSQITVPLEAIRGKPSNLSFKDAQGGKPSSLSSKDAQGGKPSSLSSKDAQGGKPSSLTSKDAQGGKPSSLSSNDAQGGKPSSLSSNDAKVKKYVEPSRLESHKDNQMSSPPRYEELKPEPPNAKTDLDKLEKHLGLTKQKYTVL
jgi:hypothetical protein